MTDGFYEEARLLKEKEGLPYIHFCFMQNLCLGKSMGYDFEAYDFLHGYCSTFAYALSTKFGYPVVIRRYTKGTGLAPVHVWCETDEGYMDVRGVTKDFREFWEEFEDFDSFDPEDDDFETLRFGTPAEYYRFAKEKEEKDRDYPVYQTVSDPVLTFARKMIRDYPDYYGPCN